MTPAAVAVSEAHTLLAYNDLKCRRIIGFVLLVSLIPAPGLAQDPTQPIPEAEDPKFAFWAEFVYTLLWRDKLVWTVTPSFRKDEQELDGSFVTRLEGEGGHRMRRWPLVKDGRCPIRTDIQGGDSSLEISRIGQNC